MQPVHDFLVGLAFVMIVLSPALVAVKCASKKTYY
jgi:hypothetical protein